MQLEIGTRFYHRRESDRYGNPRYCVVLQVAFGHVYWRFNERGVKPRGSFELAKASEHVLRIVT
jgi:hypothetical protein